VDRGDLHVAVIMMPVEAQVLDAQVGKAHVVVEVGQVVFERPPSDFFGRAIGSAVGIRDAAIALVEPLLVLTFELVVQQDVLDSGVAFEEALDLVEVRLEDVRVVLQLARLHQPRVELLAAILVTWIVVARVMVALTPMRLQQAVAAVREEHRDVAPAVHPNGVDEPLVAEVPQLAVTRVERAIVAVAEVVAWDHAEGADRRQRAALRTAQRVLALAVEHTLTLVATRKLELAEEHITRVPMALTPVAVARIFGALPRVVSPARVLTEHGLRLSFRHAAAARRLV